MKGKLIKWSHEVGKEDVAVAGGKGAQGCWASLFEPRAMFYRQEQG